MSGTPRPASGHTVDALVAEHRALGRYEIVYRVARGGMATVYLARLSGTQGFTKWVAIKTIHPHVADDPKYVRMFLDESKLAARINHPNVCSVTDFGESDGTYYLAMEYLHGQALSTVVRRAVNRDDLPTAVGARIVAGAARGLHAAHELRDAEGRPAGVVHRDVSPQNIFVLYDGVAKVVDFGIAKTSDPTGERTHTTELKGKLAYMAPEQVSRSVIDRRADLWALGVVLWETTTGKRLFHRTSEIATLNAVAYEEIPRPSSRRSDYPPALEAIVMRALERDPDRRYATAAEFARDLELHLATLPTPVMDADVGTFMHTIFAEEIATREQALRERERGPITPVWGSPAAPPAAVVPDLDVPDRPARRPSDVPATGIGDPPEATGDDAPVESGIWTSDHTRTNSGDRPAPVAPVAPVVLPRSRPAAPRTSERRTLGLLALAMVAIGFTSYVAFSRLARARSTPASSGTVETPSTSPAPAPSPNSSAHPTAAVTSPAANGSSNAANDAGGAPAATRTTHDTPARRSSGPSTSRGSASTTTSSGHSSASHTAPPPQLPAAMGRLNLLAVPSARVFERGRTLGLTPLVQLPMTAGTHTLRLVPTDGRPARTITVTIRPGEATPHREVW